MIGGPFHLSLVMSSPHAQRFARLTELLAHWQPLWAPEPFRYRRAPWGAAFPDLEAWLLGLNEAERERLEAEPFAPSRLGDWLPVAELAGLCEVAPLPEAAGARPLPEAWATHVGGRKWAQISAFAARLAPAPAYLEWCAGKGHLGRALARRDQARVIGLEWQAPLCQAGQALAEAQGADLELHTQDVMADSAADWLTPGRQLVALHACGDLHGRLIQRAAERRLPLTLAPCCYQRTAEASYRPLSRQGEQAMAEHGLALTREQLALAVQETVTAPRQVRLSRARANAWRLGFDELQREVRGEDRYLPVPSLAYGRLPDDFAGFCRWAAAEKGLPLPSTLDSTLDWARFEAAGAARQARVERLELVRHLFRRPLELWLVLDRLLCLEEAGLAVRLGTFCERSLTPRNLLIQAE